MRSVLVMLLAGLFVAAGCSAGDSEPVGVSGGQPGRDADAVPAGESESGSVESDVEELLAEHDEVVNEIVADPSVAADPDSSLVERYRTLFEPDSEVVEGAIDNWRQMADEGLSIGPYDDEHPTGRTRIDGVIEVVSDDEVRVPVCEERRERSYVDGRLTGGLPFMEQPGELVAVRVDGEWLVRSWEVRDDLDSCQETEAGDAP